MNTIHLVRSSSEPFQLLEKHYIASLRSIQLPILFYGAQSIQGLDTISLAEEPTGLLKSFSKKSAFAPVIQAYNEDDQVMFLAMADYLAFKKKAPEQVNAIPLFTEQSPEALDLIRRAKRYIEQDHILVPSEYGQRLLMSQGIDSRYIHILPPAHITRELPPTNPTQSFMVACIAPLEPNQGIETLIQALERLQEFIPQLRIVLIGDGGEKRRILWLVEHLHLRGKVNIVTTQDQYEKFLVNIDVLVAGESEPQLWNPMIIEAMSQSIPVLASNIGSYQDIIEHNKTGLLFEPNNVTMLTEHLLNLYNHPDWAKHYSQSALQTITEKLSITVFKEHLLARKKEA